MIIIFIFYSLNFFSATVYISNASYSYQFNKRETPQKWGFVCHNRRNYASNQQTLTIILNFQLLLLTISPTQAVLSMRTTRSKKYNQRILSAYNSVEVYAAAVWLL